MRFQLNVWKMFTRFELQHGIIINVPQFNPEAPHVLEAVSGC